MLSFFLFSMRGYLKSYDILWKPKTWRGFPLVSSFFQATSNIQWSSGSSSSRLSSFMSKTSTLLICQVNLILSYNVTEKTASPFRPTIGVPRGIDHHVPCFWNVRRNYLLGTLQNTSGTCVWRLRRWMKEWIEHWILVSYSCSEISDWVNNYVRKFWQTNLQISVLAIQNVLHFLKFSAKFRQIFIKTKHRLFIRTCKNSWFFKRSKQVVSSHVPKTRHVMIYSSWYPDSWTKRWSRFLSHIVRQDQIDLTN
jgi:hypothetical protein